MGAVEAAMTALQTEIDPVFDAYMAARDQLHQVIGDLESRIQALSIESDSIRSSYSAAESLYVAKCYPGGPGTPEECNNLKTSMDTLKAQLNSVISQLNALLEQLTAAEEQLGIPALRAQLAGLMARMETLKQQLDYLKVQYDSRCGTGSSDDPCVTAEGFQGAYCGTQCCPYSAYGVSFICQVPGYICMPAIG